MIKWNEGLTEFFNLLRLDFKGFHQTSFHTFCPLNYGVVESKAASRAMCRQPFLYFEEATLVTQLQEPSITSLNSKPNISKYHTGMEKAKGEINEIAIQ